VDFKVITWKDRLSGLSVESWRPEIQLFCFTVWGSCVPVTAEIWGRRFGGCRCRGGHPFSWAFYLHLGV